MASDVVSIERMEDRQMAVDPLAIEAEFTAIWRDAASSGYDQSSVRLRVLNFVAIGLREDDDARFDDAMAVLPQQQPCRGIMALASRAEGSLEAMVSARCLNMPSGVKHLCAEEVRLWGMGSQQRELSSAVLGLLVPELPVALWLMDGPDATGSLAQELLETTDRLFFDTANDAVPASAYKRMLRDGERFEVQLTDLAWARTATWRELIAQFFDGDGLAQLATIAAIEIDCGDAGVSSEGLLLAGWLVSRLGLSLADVSVTAGGIEATLYDRSRGVRLALSRGKGAAGVCELRIRTEHVLMSVAAHAESGHIHVRQEWGKESSRRTVANTPEDDASVIARALEDYGDDAVYLDAVGSALALLGA
jgi:glucose-6-phosphate dehydrogenase assembly protein OpcA